MLPLRYYWARYRVYVIAVPLIAAVGYCVYRTPSEDDRSTQGANRSLTAEHVVQIRQLIERYNPVIDWRPALPSVSGSLFSSELQDAMRPLDGRPALIASRVFDIQRKKDKHILILSRPLSYPEIRFQLECSRELVDQLIDYSRPRSDILQQVLVIAKIDSVRKPTLTQEFDDEGQTTALTLQPAFDRFLIDGSCVDAAYLGSEYSSAHEREIVAEVLRASSQSHSQE